MKTIFTTCKTNNDGINNTVDLKNINLIKNSIENITICKQTQLNFYNQISQYLENTIKNLPAHEKNEIDHDLQRNNLLIQVKQMNFLMISQILPMSFFNNTDGFQVLKI